MQYARFWAFYGPWSWFYQGKVIDYGTGFFAIKLGFCIWLHVLNVPLKFYRLVNYFLIMSNITNYRRRSLTEFVSVLHKKYMPTGLRMIPKITKNGRSFRMGIIICLKNSPETNKTYIWLIDIEKLYVNNDKWGLILSAQFWLPRCGACVKASFFNDAHRKSIYTIE